MHSNLSGLGTVAWFPISSSSSKSDTLFLSLQNGALANEAEVIPTRWALQNYLQARPFSRDLQQGAPSLAGVPLQLWEKDALLVCVPWPPCPARTGCRLSVTASQGIPHPLAWIHFQCPPTEDEVLRTLQSFFAQRDLCSLSEDPCLWLLDPREQSLWWRIWMSTCICSLGLRRQAFPQQPSEGPCVLLFTSKVWVLCAKLSKDRFPKQLPPITWALEPHRSGC